MTRVTIEVIRNLTDQRAGTRAEVELNEATTGMINGGFWQIVETEQPADKAQPAARKGRAAAEDEASGEDQA